MPTIFVDEEFIKFLFFCEILFFVGFLSQILCLKKWIKKNSSSKIRRIFVCKFFVMCRCALLVPLTLVPQIIFEKDLCLFVLESANCTKIIYSQKWFECIRYKFSALKNNFDSFKTGFDFQNTVSILILCTSLVTFYRNFVRIRIF